MNDNSEVENGLARYVRQMRYPPIGESGQKRLRSSHALICGCGALGSVIANTLTRAGVGRLRIVDRDFLEISNLQRQVLYDERDVAAGLPKVIAAAKRLSNINSQVEIEPIVADVDHTNIRSLLDGVNVILDGTDNLETRYLLNDAAISLNIPWIYGGCIGANGHTMTIIPGETGCFRCLYRDPPPPGVVETCDSAGILAPIINVIASLESCEAIKILSGHPEAVNRDFQIFELWDNRIRHVSLKNLAKGSACPACVRRIFPWLNGEMGSHTAVLCGRNAVQVSHPEQFPTSLEMLENRLQGIGTVTRNKYLLKLAVDDYVLTVFPDGRAIITGTEDVAEARSVYTRYVGN